MSQLAGVWGQECQGSWRGHPAYVVLELLLRARGREASRAAVTPGSRGGGGLPADSQGHMTQAPWGRGGKGSRLPSLLPEMCLGPQRASLELGGSGCAHGMLFLWKEGGQ